MKVIVISGSMGAGKTTVMAEASDLLAANGIAHAAIDADTLGIVHLPGTSSTDIMYRNLETVWSNFAAAGVTRLLLAEAVEHRGEIERIRRVVPGAEITVCRLAAGIETMRQRVRSRERGLLQEKFVGRVAELNALLDKAQVEDFSLDNDGRSVTEVARELLAHAGWLKHAGPLPNLETDGAAVDTEKNKELIRRWIDFSNAGLVGSLDDFVVGDYIGHLGAVTMDRNELERLERAFCRAFPDAHHVVEDLIAEGDRVVLRTTARATHRAEFEGIAQTDRAVEFTGLVVYRIRDGRIAEAWGEVDFLRLIRELTP
jgi:predicted ester cyclase/shikimate kinase